MSLECPTCFTRSWSARCTNCGFALLPGAEPVRVVDAPSLELDVQAAPPVVPEMAVSGRAPLRQVPRPPGRTLPSLELAVAWTRDPAGLFGLIAVVAVLLAVQQHQRVAVAFACGLVAIAATWTALAFALNTRIVTVAKGRLRARHVPVPVFGDHDVDVDKVEQIFVRTVFGTRRKHRWMGVWSPLEDFVVYSVHADVDGKEIQLFSGLGDVSLARRFEQKLESHIGITDDPSRSLAERGW